jgi:hypothetical protein
VSFRASVNFSIPPNSGSTTAGTRYAGMVSAFFPAAATAV